MNTYHEMPLTFSHPQQQQQQSNLWSTMIPLGGVVRSEQQVKVKLNPQYRVLNLKVYPRGTRADRSLTSINQKIHHVISLPKNIRLDQLQVKLTQHGDLVVFAPFKFPMQQHQQGWNDTILRNTAYWFQQSQGQSEFQQGMNIPVKWIKGSRKNIHSTSPFRGLTSSSESESTTTSGSESSSCSRSSSSSCTSSSTESESDYERWNKKKFTKGDRRRQFKGYSNSSNVNGKVQKFIQLLKTIFYPNNVECKLKPIHQGQSNLSTFIVKIQPSTPLTSQSQVKCRVHPNQPNVLIVEMERSHTDRLTGSFGVKYVRREIRVPQWLNLQQMVYRVKEQGYLKIKLPCFLNVTQRNTPYINTTCKLQYPSTFKGIEEGMKKKLWLGKKY